MDRFDEQKPDHKDDEEPRDEHVRDHTVREGDVLGLGGAAVPKAPGDPTTEYDPESVARRRERASGEDEEGAERSRGTDRSKGATAIDMGSGGAGTDITGK